VFIGQIYAVFLAEIYAIWVFLENTAYTTGRIFLGGGPFLEKKSHAKPVVAPPLTA
jgi:hypothetical protein